VTKPDPGDEERLGAPVLQGIFEDERLRISVAFYFRELRLRLRSTVDRFVLRAPITPFIKLV